MIEAVNSSIRDNLFLDLIEKVRYIVNHMKCLMIRYCYSLIIKNLMAVFSKNFLAVWGDQSSLLYTYSSTKTFERLLNSNSVSSSINSFWENSLSEL